MTKSPIDMSSAQIREKMTAGMEYFLRQYRHHEVYFYPTPGNAGDSLIQTGTYQAFKRAGVALRLLHKSDNLTGKILFLGGGGNLVPLYNENQNFLEENDVLTRVAHLVILPSTIRGNEALLAKMDRRVTVFCRELPSYLHVLKNANTNSVYLDHDMAIHLDLDIFESEKRIYLDVPELYVKILTRVVPGFSPEQGLSGRRFFMREDGESQGGGLLPNNIDLSDIFQFGTWPGNAEKSVGCLFRAITEAEHVTTDRLHVGIACSLLEKPCTFVDNNYRKNSDVYVHTIQKYCVDFLYKE